MAAKAITPIECKVNKITKTELTAPADGSNGLVFTMPRKTEEYVNIIVDGGASGGTVTLKKPTKGYYAAAASDLTLSLSANEIAVIRFESAKYANTDGTVVFVPSATTVKAAVIY